LKDCGKESSGVEMTKEIYRCDFCGEETDKFRYCVRCGRRLCWSHVVRLEITLHDVDVPLSYPVYICRYCAAELVLPLLESKASVQTIKKQPDTLRRIRHILREEEENFRIEKG